MPSFHRIIMSAAFAAVLATAIGKSFKLGPHSDERSFRKPVPIVNLENKIKQQLASKDTSNLDNVRRNIEKLLREAPLNDNALVYYAKALMLEKGAEYFDPISIFEVVKERNPRNRENLNAMLLYAIETNDPVRVLEIVDALYLLSQNRRTELMNLIVAIYDFADWHLLIDSHLAGRPVWEVSFLNRKTLKVRDADLEKLSQTIAISIDLTEDVSLIKPYVGRILTNLVRIGDHEKAYNLWQKATKKAKRRTNNEKMKSLRSLNYNPNLAESASPAPFNWTFFTTSDVTFEKGLNGVFISYVGNKQRTVAMQYFKPQLDPLELVVKANYNYTDWQGHFSIVLRCLSSNFPEIDVVLDEANRGKSKVKKSLENFSENCTLASLSIMAKPGIFSERISATFDYISVEFVEAE